ncbi:MAG: PAS domain S-box protein, partial [Chitinivibrionales bacterium]|nr:PAS domain S-box protein [Chitinivibrionales bacterium]
YFHSVSARESSEPKPYHGQSRRHDGSIIDIQVDWDYKRNERGGIEGFIAIITDVTEQRRAERKIEQQNAFLESIISSIADPLYVVNVSDYTISIANNAAQKQGITAGSFCYQSTHRRSRPCDGSDDPCSIGCIQKYKKGVVLEHKHYSPDGTVIYVEVHGYPVFNEHGDVAQIVEYIVDVTARKKAEDDLRRAKAEADAASRAKSEFLAAMSHELRTPLNSIMGFSEILQDESYGALNDKQKKYVTNISKSGRHLLSLINDILDLSKIEEGRMELHCESVDLPALLKESLRMFEEKARMAGLFHSPPSLSGGDDLTLFADKKRLSQILFNLLSNAVKFTPEGGSISLNARRISAEEVYHALPDVQLQKSRLQSAQGWVEISVHDTGIGIEPKNIERIFKKFEQIDSSYSRAYEGTGLGLTLTKLFVEMHGGYMCVKSGGAGKGSTFFVYLPVAGDRHRH